MQRQQSRAEWLPKLGAIYAWRPNVELFASYSRNVLMLATTSWPPAPTQHLRPERSDNFDVGVRWNGTRAGIAMQVFAQRFDGRLGAVNLAAVGGDLYLQGAIEILNVGGVDSSGFELAASFDLVKRSPPTAPTRIWMRSTRMRYPRKESLLAIAW